MSESTFQFGKFSLDVLEHRLLRDGEPVPLTPRVFNLLRVLVENAGHLVEKERLLKEVWSDAFVEEANLNRAVSVLRKALGETPTQRYIETVPKRGYRFVATVHGPHSNAAVPVGQRSPDAPASTASAWTANARTMIVVGFVMATVAASGIYVGIGNGGNDRRSGTGSSVHRQLTFTGREITPALSPDGARIAYVSKESPHRTVVVQDLASGRQDELFRAPEAGALRWSPDGSELLFWARGGEISGQFIAPVSGRRARKLADGFFVSSWSPDGSVIAVGLFVSGSIGLVNRLGELQRRIQLKGTREWMWDLDWSAVHGRLLVVVDDEQRRPTIWTIRSDGSEQRRVFTGETEILAARWAPSGDAIYFFTRVNQTVSLYKLSLDAGLQTAAGDPIPLVTGLETDEGFGISADGTRLVYARAPYYANLWRVDLPDPESGAAPRQTQLTHGTAVIERPRVSPDGRTIVFNMGYESRANLYTIPASGGTPEQLTFFNAFSVDGAWSPDGRAVAFASTEGGKARVWVVSADGSAPRPVSTGDMSEAFDVTWAPGERILYQQLGNRNFYVVDPQGRGEKLLIKDSSVGWSGSAEYSPDGKRIAVSWNRRPVRGLWLIDSGDSRETLVLGAPSPSASFPFPIGWSRDGRFIFAAEGKRAAYRGITASFEETITDVKIARVPVGGGAPETLLTLPFEEVGSMAMFPDGRRLVASVYSSRSDVWVVENFDVPSVNTRTVK